MSGRPSRAPATTSGFTIRARRRNRWITISADDALAGRSLATGRGGCAGGTQAAGLQSWGDTVRVRLGAARLIADDLYLMAHDDVTGKPLSPRRALGIGLAAGLRASA